ncbi:MAG: sugar phosphate isomerase/epimerase family protein [Limisphaerales bacterium]
MNLNRRAFSLRLLTATAAATGLAAAPAAEAPRRRMTVDLTPGAVGISAEFTEILRLAHAHGFESVQPDIGHLSRQDADGLARTLERLREAGLKWGAAGLPVEFRQSDEAFQKDFERLPNAARALQKAGVTRIGTWIRPGHQELEYAANLEIHARRLGRTAGVLRDHGIRLGLEYVGTPSLRARVRHPFVHNLSQTRELIRAIDVPGTGLVLDSWHWWTAGDTAADLRKLTNADVVAVDLNDAPAGIALADQQDNRRELPLATGVIPVRDFLQALMDIQYDGPVRAEPFNAPLNQLDNEPAAAAVASALRKAMALVDPR